ncbi:MAG: lipopolysaccharide kinase InaA family protein [Cellvibrionaceae bacterium]|nr:lipopolysaccharide kinase InaA family protein [Cellvibrionaceae bacterium]MCV6628002.1 lipopolysaccharide kinase InaA family protein [Cellvibrionaceae bacterium]
MWPANSKKNDEIVIDPEFQQWFRPAHLLSFNALWQLQFVDSHKIAFPESGKTLIDRFEMAGPNGPRPYYIKRQLNRSVRSWRRPFGEPTFALELRNIDLCENYRIPTFDPVYYCERQMHSGLAAILILRALDGYEYLRDIMRRWHTLEPQQRESFMITVGKAVGRIHNAGLSHARLGLDDFIVDLTQIPQWRLASPQYIAPAKGDIQAQQQQELQHFIVSLGAMEESELNILLQAYHEANPSNKLTESVPENPHPTLATG